MLHTRRITLEMDCREARVNVGREVIKDVGSERNLFKTHMALGLPTLRGKLFASSREGSSLLAVLGVI